MILNIEIQSPSNKPLPARFNMELIEMLQTKIAPDIFTTRVAYDGRKNIFATKLISLPGGSQEALYFHVFTCAFLTSSMR